MALLRTIQFLHNNNEWLVERNKIIENQWLSEQVDTMISKTDSISKGTRTYMKGYILSDLMLRIYYRVLIR